MDAKLRKAKTVIGAVVFLSIVGSVLLGTTYLFRQVNSSGYKDRITVAGIKEEKEHSLDVIYIGGSAAFVYWEPLKAYKDYGFTSYDLATNSIQAESILSYIKYAQKYQKPDLYVIGVRAFQYYTEKGSESGFRTTVDSLDMNINRFQLIHEYLGNHTLDIDPLSVYLDLSKYHTNYKALANAQAWHLIDNSGKNNDKGCEIYDTWSYLQEPGDFKTDKRATLIPENERVLNELLNYLDDNNLKALFVVCPYSVTEEDYEKYNTIGDIVSSHGYRFLNTNDFYEEMGVDFSTDFYNTSHMNGVGAEKYTAFLEEYIADHYDLPDHRGDEAFSEWDELAAQFETQSERCKQKVYERIAAADDGVKNGEFIRTIEDFPTWSSYVKDDRYSLLLVGSGEAIATESYSMINRLKYLGIDTAKLFGTNDYINLITSFKDTKIPAAKDGALEVQIGPDKAKTNVAIDNRDSKCSILIEGQEYSRRDSEGLNIVVLDNGYRTVIDSVTLKKKDGDIVIER